MLSQLRLQLALKNPFGFCCLKNLLFSGKIEKDRANRKTALVGFKVELQENNEISMLYPSENDRKPFFRCRCGWKIFIEAVLRPATDWYSSCGILFGLSGACFGVGRKYCCLASKNSLNQ